MRRTSAGIAIALAVAAVPVAADAPDTPFATIRLLWQQARAIPATTRPAESLAAFDAALAASPVNEGLLLSAAAAAQRAQDRPRLFALLTRVAALGGTLDAGETGTLSAGLGLRSDDPLIKALAANRAPVVPGKVAAMLPKTIRLVEGIAYDPRRDALYVSSVVNRTIYRIDHKRRPMVALVMPPGLGSPMALAWDAAHRTLWAALDPQAPGGPGTAGRGGIMASVSGSGRPIFIPGPAGSTPGIGDIMVDPRGTVYAADGRSGAVYRCRPGCAALEQIVAPGVLRSAQGMVLSADGRHLYVADYAYGLALVDLANGAVRPVRTAPGVAIDGLDGLGWRDGAIIAVQNGWQPARLIAITLDRDGTRAASLRVIARGGPLSDPTQIAVTTNGDILIVGNAQWHRYEAAATPRNIDQLPTVLIRIPRQPAVAERSRHARLRQNAKKPAKP